MKWEYLYVYVCVCVCVFEEEGTESDVVISNQSVKKGTGGRVRQVTKVEIPVNRRSTSDNRDLALRYKRIVIILDPSIFLFHFSLLVLSPLITIIWLRIVSSSYYFDYLL